MKKYAFILATLMFALISTANLNASGTDVAIVYGPSNPPPNSKGTQGPQNYGGNQGYQNYGGNPGQQNYGGYSAPAQTYYAPAPAPVYAPPPGYPPPGYVQPYGGYGATYVPGVPPPLTEDQVNPGAAQANRLYESYKYLPQ